MNDYLNAFRNEQYVNFAGRARRQEYWMFTLFNTLISFALFVLVTVFILPAILYGPRASDGGPPSSSELLLIAFCLTYVIGLIIPVLGLTVRRLHDAGYSGWLSLIMAVPLIGGITLLVLLVQDSTPGPNKWGANPKTDSVFRPPF